MTMEINERLKDYFARCRNIRMAFLFGSQARGRVGPHSDVDIGAYFEPGYTLQDVYRIWNELEDTLSLKVDLLVLKRRPLPWRGQH